MVNSGMAKLRHAELDPPLGFSPSGTIVDRLRADKAFRLALSFLLVN
ncbi:hypothetical protein QE435_004966 [Rhizobium sp. SORGH_AS 787]|nr:hypothetical protein [Rhizobium sp. SORGH_AS_0787]